MPDGAVYKYIKDLAEDSNYEKECLRMNKYKEYEAIAVIGGRRLNVGTAEVYIDTEKHKPSKLLPKYI